MKENMCSFRGTALQYSRQVSDVTDAVTAAKAVMKDARTAFSEESQKKRAERPPKAPASKAPAGKAKAKAKAV